MAFFRPAPVKSNQGTALPMLRHHQDGAFRAFLPPKPTAASQTNWDKASDFSINPSESRKAGKIITRGLLFPSVLLIPALLISTHTYFASVSPLGNRGAMKYTQNFACHRVIRGIVFTSLIFYSLDWETTRKPRRASALELLPLYKATKCWDSSSTPGSG